MRVIEIALQQPHLDIAKVNELRVEPHLASLSQASISARTRGSAGLSHTLPFLHWHWLLQSYAFFRQKHGSTEQYSDSTAMFTARLYSVKLKKWYGHGRSGRSGSYAPGSGAFCFTSTINYPAMVAASASGNDR